MRGAVRREARALLEEEALHIIKNAENGVLATVNEEGFPCTTALNHTLFDDGCIYFHSGAEGEKIDNIKAHPQVSFFVTQTADVVYEQFTTAFSSAVVHGTITFVEDGALKTSALQKIVERFSDGSVTQEVVDDFIAKSMPHVLVLKLVPEHITGKARLSRTRACLKQL